MVGRVHSKKGFDLALPAIRAARDAGKALSLTIVGPNEGDYRAKVEALAGSLALTEQVRFTGLLDSEALAREYERADIVLMPSYQENFGMSAAEGMLAGRPVIVSNTVNIASEIVACGGGLPVPLEIPAIAEAIQSIASSPDTALAMGQRGRDYATNTYSVNAVGRRMAHAYQSICVNR
jgi:glycosyltransferase involved in cell wall biosynthesis